MRLAQIALFFLPIALCSCAAPADRMSFYSSPTPFAWDGSGNDPNRPRGKKKRVQILTDENPATRAREEALASLRPNSTAWWTIHNEIEAEHDKRLARKLLICAGCLRDPPQAEVTGTIPRQ